MITKLQAAELQLNSAIMLFFENHDLLSSHTLAAASREITDDLCEKQVSQIFNAEAARLGDPLKVRLSFREEIKILIKPEHLKEAMALFRRRQNFLKHADRDPNAEMEEIQSKDLALEIFFAIKNFALLAQRVTREMTTFLYWIGVAHPELVKDPSGDFSKKISECREMWREPYSKETLNGIHDALKLHRG